MSRLPVIVGFGGINASGRSSFHHGYRRTVIDRLDNKDTIDVYCGLATMMGYLSYKDGGYFDRDGVECPPHKIVERFGEGILKNTHIRKISPALFDPDRVIWNSKIVAKPQNDSSIKIVLKKNRLPSQIPSNWEIRKFENDSDSVEVCIHGNMEFFLEDRKKLLVQSGGQIPEGFNPGNFYKSNHHARGLQLTIFGASDAIFSMGIELEEIKRIVPPDMIGTYSCSAMGQLDEFSCLGFLRAFSLGKKTTSKQMAMGLPEMPADFINAYILGSVGYTAANVGACATTLYNLELAVNDIRQGKRRVAIVGNSEAPLVPEVMESYRVTSAVAEDEELIRLDRDKALSEPDYKRSCRPFSNNCGFTMGEAAQYFILFDDDLALELGAQIYGSIGDIFINADGYKKSIASPGFGNYICLAKAVASARALFGIESVRQRSFIHSHGTGTPQNRTTESHVLNEIAKAFGIEKWPVAAIKCYIGHSLGPASGDQIASALGTWKYGLIPGIFTLDSVAEDVCDSNLLLSREHSEVDPEHSDVAFVNAKGFGGNNASGSIISPYKTVEMLKRKHGEEVFNNYLKKNERVVEEAENYDRKAIQGIVKPIYDFGKDLLEGSDLDMTDQYMNIRGYGEKINLSLSSQYPDMTLSNMSKATE